MNENQAQIDMLRAAKARELLDNSVLTEALDTIERDIIRLWGQCPARDTEGREYLWKHYKAAQSFRTILEEFIRTGEYASSQLTANKERRSLLSRLGV